MRTRKVQRAECAYAPRAINTQDWTERFTSVLLNLCLPSVCHLARVNSPQTALNTLNAKTHYAPTQITQNTPSPLENAFNFIKDVEKGEVKVYLDGIFSVLFS